MIGAYIQVGEHTHRCVGYVITERGCWHWTGKLNRQGYGVYLTGSAHRFMYKKYKGRIKEGLFLDHLCRNRACVNPDHLEPVTCQENLRRGMISRRKERWQELIDYWDRVGEENL